MKKSKVWIATGIIVILAATAFWYFTTDPAAEINYRFDKVQRGDISVVVTATGTLSADTTVEVGTQVSGTISKLYADFNSHVKKNQVIAQLDPTFLEASVRDAEATLQKAVAQLNQSKRAYDRTKALLDKGLASQSDYDVALAAYESDAASKKSADAELERAKINLRYATILAPIDGVVISRAVDVGQTVAASLAAPTLFTIANDLTKMQVQADVDEADIARVQVGEDVAFTVDAYPELTFHGIVSQIRLQPIVQQNVVNYTVIIDVPNPDLKLMPGMTATATIMVTKKENVLKVPTIALRFQPPQEMIEKKNDSTSAGDSSGWMQRKRQFTQQGEGQGGAKGFSPHPTMVTANSVGRLWIVGKDKKLEPVYVRSGLSDGTFTEIIHGKVDENQEIVVGILSQKPTNSATPFSGRQRF